MKVLLLPGSFRSLIARFSFNCQVTTAVAAVSLLAGSAARLKANVYATNIRLNGAATNAPLYIPCGSVQINYLLNEDATAGVTIDLLAGTNVVRSLVLTNGSGGTLRGVNTVIWDGKDNSGNILPFGAYAVRISAAAEGYSDWTQISEELHPGNYAWDPVGIAVNCSTNSPAYGRVFVANASEGPNPGFNPGDRVGLLLLNADGSRVPRAAFSDGGWEWAGDGFSPWKIEVSADNSVYVTDWGSNNVVLRFDQSISEESRQLVLREDNRPSSGASLSGLFVTGHGTNTDLWMTDANPAGSVGVRRWHIGADGQVAANDLGVTVLQAGEGSDLSVAPYDVAVDRSNRICTIQYRTNAADPAFRVLCFTNHDQAPLPLTNAAWKVGSGDNSKRGGSGVAVDASGTHVAVAFRGALVNNSLVGGRTTVFEVESGSVVANIVTDLPGGESHDHSDVAWDNAGNLYDLDNYDSIWRVYSPPGSNAATTVAVFNVYVTEPPVAPILSAISHTNGEFRFTLTGRTDLSYVVEASTDFQSWTPVWTDPPTNCATRVVTVNAPGARNFYRATPLLPAPPVPPMLSAPAWTNNEFTFTLTGQANASYVILAATNLSTNLADWTRVWTNTSSDPVRTLTLPAPESRSFYRALVAP